MPDASYVQTSFHGGKWSAFAQGRMDLPAYKTAMAVCQNAYPIEEGACPRRPGFRYTTTTRGGFPAKLITFAFDTVAPYTMEFTDGHLRFVDDADVITDAARFNVTAISPSSPTAIVTITPGAPLATGDQILFEFSDPASLTASAVLSRRKFRIQPIDSGVNNFFIYDAVTGAAMDGAALGWGVGVNLTVARVQDLVTPYAGSLWRSVRSVQSESQTLLLQGTVKPQVLIAATPPSATQAATFSIAPATFVDGPYLDPPTDGSTITATANTGVVTLTASGLDFINSGSGFQSTDVGRSMRLLSQPAIWAAATSYSVGDKAMFPDANGIVYTRLTSAANGVIPPAAPAIWAIDVQGQNWAYGNIVSINSTSSVQFQFTVGLSNSYVTPITFWRLGVYSETTGYPTCGCYHEGRVWLAGAVKNRFDACMVGGIKDSEYTFSPTNQFGNVSSASGISYTFDSSELNQILWMMPDLQGIVAGTLGGEWLIQTGTANTAITAANIQAHRVTKYGCADIEPRRTGLTTVFVQKFKRRLLEYLADAFSGKFYGPNLSEFAKDVTFSGIAEIAHQEELAPIIWVRLTDGKLAGITYRRITMMSSQPPQFMGWHTHELGSNRLVESICTGPSVGGLLDALSIVTNDAVTGIRHIEVATTLFDEDNVLTQAWFLDNAVTPTHGTTITVSGQQYIRLSGLWHLNNKKVTAWVGGLDCGDYTVSDTGYIDVPYGAAGGAFTQVYLAGLTTSGTDFGSLAVSIDQGMLTVPAVIGFTYTTRGQLLRPFEAKDTGSRNGPGFGKKRRVHKYAAQLQNALGVSFGTTFDHMRPANFKTSGGNTIPVTQMFSGIHRDTCDDSETFDGQLCWEVTRPYPCTVVALGGFVETKDV